MLIIDMDSHFNEPDDWFDKALSAAELLKL
jgi:hypothetical protein